MTQIHGPLYAGSEKPTLTGYPCHNPPSSGPHQSCKVCDTWADVLLVHNYILHIKYTDSLSLRTMVVVRAAILSFVPAIPSMVYTAVVFTIPTRAMCMRMFRRHQQL